MKPSKNIFKFFYKTNEKYFSLFLKEAMPIFLRNPYHYMD